MDQLIEIVQRKKQEMSMFKSDCQRFENSITATPGLASYKYCGIYAVFSKTK